MQVKMKTIASGATWSAEPGETITVPDAEGKDLCEGGYAIPVKSVAVETATAPPEETAKAKRGRPSTK